MFSHFSLLSPGAGRTFSLPMSVVQYIPSDADRSRALRSIWHFLLMRRLVLMNYFIMQVLKVSDYCLLARSFTKGCYASYSYLHILYISSTSGKLAVSESALMAQLSLFMPSERLCRPEYYGTTLA